MKKTIAILLSTVLLLLSFVSCQPEESPLPNEDPQDQALIEDLSGYTVIIPSNPDREISTAATALVNAIAEKTGVTLEIREDFIIEERGIVEVDREILIGATNREASKGYDILLHDDYEVAVVESKLLMLGGSLSATVNAVTAWIELYLSKSYASELAVYADALLSYRHAYAIRSFSLNGIDIREWQIVYPINSVYLRSAAEKLSQGILQLTGMEISVVSDGKYQKKTNTNAILIGVTKQGAYAESLAQNTAVYASEAGLFRIQGGSEFDTVRAVNLFLELLLTQSGAVALDYSTAQIQPLEAAKEYSVMSFNVLGTDIDARVSLVADAILTHLPDSVGIQEGNSTWVNELSNALASHYDYVNPHNASSNLLLNAIFYRRDKLKLIESGGYWLSATPNNPSKFPNTDQRRVVTYAVFEDLETGERFTHYNTHIGWNNDGGNDVPAKQCDVIMTKAENDFPYPYVVTGDFNTMPTSSLYKSLTKTWWDARKVAEKTTEDWTCDFKIMDYCFLSNQVFATEFYVVNDPYVDKVSFNNGETKGQSYYLSDHYPIVVKFYLP